MPVSGAWRVSFSMASLVGVGYGDQNRAYLYINGNQLDETEHYTYSDNMEQENFTGGREVTLEASAGDKIEISADAMDGYYGEILYCAEYISKM